MVRRYIIIGVFVAAGITGAGWYFLAKQPVGSFPLSVTQPTEMRVVEPAETPLEPREIPVSEAANWKTHINSDYHYSIKIPQRTKIVAEEKNLEGEKRDYFEGYLVDNVRSEEPALREEEIVGETDDQKFNYILKQGNLSIHIEVVKGVESDFRAYAERGADLL